MVFRWRFACGNLHTFDLRLLCDLFGKYFFGGESETIRIGGGQYWCNCGLGFKRGFGKCSWSRRGQGHKLSAFVV